MNPNVQMNGRRLSVPLLLIQLNWKSDADDTNTLQNSQKIMDIVQGNMEYKGTKDDKR